MREADGMPALQTQSMRAVFTHEMSMDHQPQSSVKHFRGIPIPRSPGKYSYIHMYTYVVWKCTMLNLCNNVVHNTISCIQVLMIIQ